MKIQFLAPLFVLFILPAAYAENVQNFSEADKDADGVLSIEEAKIALPDVLISDANGDGMVNRSEAADSIDGYVLTDDSQDQAEAPVQEADYRLIVQALATNAPRNVSSNN